MIHKLFTFPIRSLIKLGEKIQEEAEKELYNILYIQQQLTELHALYEMGEVDEKTYLDREQDLLNRYKIAKEREKNGL
jgi:hypothetical protein